MTFVLDSRQKVMRTLARRCRPYASHGGLKASELIAKTSLEPKVLAAVLTHLRAEGLVWVAYVDERRLLDPQNYRWYLTSKGVTVYAKGIRFSPPKDNA